jgi:hypothetical protein
MHVSEAIALVCLIISKNARIKENLSWTKCDPFFYKLFSFLFLM